MTTKLFGFNAIQKHVHRSHIKASHGHSIAADGHKNEREIARRLRQQARNSGGQS